MKKAIETKNAPAALGPYSQAISVGSCVYVSGQTPLDPLTGKLVGTDIATQTRQAINNIVAILKVSDLDLCAVVKTTVFLSDMNNFSAMNEVYASFFNTPFPARSTVEVARLPKDALVEIEAIAYRE